MPYENKQLIITHSVPGLTARVNVFSLEAMDIVIRMANLCSGAYDLKEVRDGPSEKIIWVRFPDNDHLEMFKILCY